MIKIDVDQRNPNKSLSKFKKKMRDSRIVIEMLEREFYEPPSQKKKNKKKKSLHRKKVQQLKENNLNNKI